MNILAHHAHVFPRSVRPEATVERLLRLMDECEIDQVVCFSPFSYQLKGTEIDGNEWLADVIKHRSELIGFGTIDFNQNNITNQVQQIHDLGMKGIKLHPAAQQFHILSAKVMEVYELAQELNLFLTFHTGVHWHRIKDYAVVDFDEIAYLYPQLRFSMEHVGGYHFFNEALAVLVNNLRDRQPRVYAGLTSVFTPNHNRYWYLSRERLQELIIQTGTDYLIFGLDFPYNLEAETKLGIQTIKEMELSESDKSKIMGGNLRRVLGLD